MKTLFIKYKGLILIVFLAGFISLVDRLVLSGQFKGIQEYKHFIYLGALLLGLAIVLSILLKEDTAHK